MKTITKIALAIGILCLCAFAQTDRPKAAVYIKGNPEGRDALRMAVNTFLVKSGKYQMIAVDALDVVAQEQNRQMGGSVSNEDIAALGRDAGAEYVCVVERTELDGISYVSTSMVSVESKIAELSDMKDLPRGERIISLIERQINLMLGISPPPEPEPTYEPEPTVAYPKNNDYIEQPAGTGRLSLYEEPQNEDYSASTKVDNGLKKRKPESNKSILKSLAFTIAGAGLIYAGVHYKKETDKSYDKYRSLSGVSEEEYKKAWQGVKDDGLASGWGFFLGGTFSLYGLITLFEGGI